MYKPEWNDERPILGEHDHCEPIPNFNVSESWTLDFWQVFVEKPGSFRVERRPISYFSWTCAHVGVSLVSMTMWVVNFPFKVTQVRELLICSPSCNVSMMLWSKRNLYHATHFYLGCVVPSLGSSGKCTLRTCALFLGCLPSEWQLSWKGLQRRHSLNSLRCRKGNMQPKLMPLGRHQPNGESLDLPP